MEQEDLFELGPVRLQPAARVADYRGLAGRLPTDIRFGGMSWSYRGWIGHVYGVDATDKRLASQGLGAYAQHPLLRTVEIDRSYYEPLPVPVLRAFAEQVPDDFRFWVKAHEDIVVQRFPEHARYGMRRGADNPRFLDATYARDAVIEPLVAGLGEKLGGLLFQFPPQDARDPRGFADRLRVFLRALPRGVSYAVELRNPELLTRAYGDALCAGEAIHCHNLWTTMPGLKAQMRLIPPTARRPLLVRWLLKAGHRYEDASAAYQPFHRLVDEDLPTREEVAQLALRAVGHGVPVVLLVDNKAEGCAPESIIRLARAIDRLQNA